MRNEDVSLHNHFDLEPICLGLIEGNKFLYVFRSLLFGGGRVLWLQMRRTGEISKIIGLNCTIT